MRKIKSDCSNSSNKNSNFIRKTNSSNENVALKLNQVTSSSQNSNSFGLNTEEQIRKVSSSGRFTVIFYFLYKFEIFFEI